MSRRDKVADVEGRGLVSCFDRLSCELTVGTKETAEYPGCIRRLTPVEYVGGEAIEEGHFLSGHEGESGIDNGHDDGHDEAGGGVSADVHDGDEEGHSHNDNGSIAATRNGKDNDASNGKVNAERNAHVYASIQNEDNNDDDVDSETTGSVVEKHQQQGKGNQVSNKLQAAKGYMDKLRQRLPNTVIGGTADTLGTSMWLTCICLVVVALTNIRWHVFGRMTPGSFSLSPHGIVSSPSFRDAVQSPASVRGVHGGGGGGYNGNVASPDASSYGVNTALSPKQMGGRRQTTPTRKASVKAM